MAKYLLHGSYSIEGNKGVVKGGGGTARRKAIVTLLESVGGKLESVYWALGKDDFFIIADLPSNVAVAAIALQVGGSGAISRLASTPLLTAEEVDAATKVGTKYTPPGQ
jgi:uncharacterized protein with GYD domain